VKKPVEEFLDPQNKEDREEEDAQQSRLDDEDSATLTLAWCKSDIETAKDTAFMPGRYQYSQVVKTPVPPFHYTKYDLVLSRKVVKKMDFYIKKNPKGVYKFRASPSERHRAELEAKSKTFIQLKVKKDVAKREKGLWKSKMEKGEKEHNRR